MGSIRARNDNNQLFLDFRYKGIRCRELTALTDSKANRTKLEKILKKIEDAISDGTFEYYDYFPNSNMVQKFEVASQIATVKVNEINFQSNLTTSTTPLFKDFYKQWLDEFSLDWRRSYKATVEQIINTRLLPRFAEYQVGSIRREDILTFRSTLAKDTGRKKDTVISPRRINAIILVLKQILNEAADRFDFTTPTLRIKQLKVPKSDVKPFTLAEVNKIIETVREDYKQYFIVRFFTGMRTGEIDGLKWKYVDWERRIIMVRETFTWGMEDYTKTDASQRDIQMSTPVYEALRVQHKATGRQSEYVFCNNDFKPLDVNNFARRVWYPLLRYLGLAKRNPYQMRHTAATLWLAAGESPEWIAKQLGHANTQMLFKVYSRFVPNLTRQDGSAFERLLRQNGLQNADAKQNKEAA